MNMMKHGLAHRVFALLLALVMVIGMLPITAGRVEAVASEEGEPAIIAEGDGTEGGEGEEIPKEDPEIEDVTLGGKTVTYNKDKSYKAEDLVEVTGDKAGDDISYAFVGISDEEVKNKGEYTIAVTVERDGYKTLSKNVKATIKPEEIKGIELGPVSKEYTGDAIELVELKGDLKNYESVTWEVTPKGGTISRYQGATLPAQKAINEYTIVLIVTNKGGNAYFEQEVTSEIKPISIKTDGLTITAKTGLVYSVDKDGVAREQELVSVKGYNKDTSGYTLEFKVGDGEWGEKATATNAGTYTVYARATKSEHHEVKDLGTRDVKIAQAEQKLAFNNSDATVKLSETASENVYVFSAAGENLSGKEIVYSLENKSSDAVADINEVTGEVTFKNAGAVTIVATREGDGNYTEAKAYVMVTVTMPNGGLITLCDGDEKTSSSVSKTDSDHIITLYAKKAKNDDNGKLTYSFGNGAAEQAGLRIDEINDNGEIAIKVTDEEALANAAWVSSGALRLVVKVSKAEGTVTNYKWTGFFFDKVEVPIYPAEEAVYNLTITFDPEPQRGVVWDYSPDPNTGWFNLQYKPEVKVIEQTITGEDNVVVPADVQYEITLTPNKKTTYSKSVELGHEGTKDYIIYVRSVDKNGKKKAARPIPLLDVQVDTGAPKAGNVKYPGKAINGVYYYQNNVTVEFPVSDSISGIKQVDWKYVPADGTESTIGGKVTPDENGMIKATLPYGEYKGTLMFTVTDVAGNTTQKQDAQVFIVDNTSPEVNVSEPFKDDTLNYHNNKTEIVFTVKEVNLDKDSFKFTLKNLEEVDPKKAEQVIPAVWNIGTDTHTATVQIEADGKYVVAVEGYDYSGNSSELVTDEFVVDKTAPVITITTTDDTDDKEDDALQEVTIQVTEHNFTAAGITADVTGVNIKGEAVTVKAAEILAYMQIDDNWDEDKDNPDVHTLVLKSTGEDDLLVDAIYSMSINCTDLAQNSAKEDTKLEDFVVDHTVPVITSITYSKYIQEISLLDKILETLTLGFYNPDKKIENTDNYYDLVVTFTAEDWTSGVESFDWRYDKQSGVSASILEKLEDQHIEEVSSNGAVFTASVNLTKMTKEQLRGYFSVRATDARTNVSMTEVNAADVKVVDTKAPVITCDYNPATNSTTSVDYYNTDIVATIKVTEANFFEEDVKITVTKNGATSAATPDWSSGEGDVHTATVTLRDDGDYKINITYTDKSLNTATPYESPKQLTIDKTPPVIGVSYNNNAVANGKYFNAPRTATVTITEHNFDVNRVKITNTAARGGVIPVASWSHSGDTHVATLAYTVDGDYTFDISMTDLATNANNGVGYGNSAAGTDFVVDTTYEEMISYEGVENGKAYGDKATVIPSIEIADINLDNWVITLVGKQLGKTTDLTDKVKGLMNDQNTLVTGKLDLFKAVQELDGIYTLTMTGTDLAGNIDTEEVIFTVNRFGSVYDFDKTLTDLVANGGAYVQTVPEDLVITEYNADKLLPGSVVIEITRDGKPLDKVIFDVTPDVNDQVKPGETGWYQYTYRISKDNFLADGIYKIYISSKDATGNTPANGNYEDKVMTFRVDATAPEITSVVGLEEAVINAQEVTVKYTIYDTIGLKSIKIFVDGQLVGTEIVDFGSDPNNYESSFTLYEKAASQHVQILVEDLAGNATDTDDENFESAYVFNKNVTVSTNFFVRWYAQTGLFWGSIAGILALIAALFFFIFGKKKKEEAAA